MSRPLLALVLALSVASSTVGQAVARPVGPEECTFSDGFAALTTALGEEIVGECVSEETYDRFGNSRQKTTEGTLFWDSRRNVVSFHNGSLLWINGRGAIDSNVTISGLSDRLTAREPITLRATEAFEFVSLAPEDLGEEWSYGVVAQTMPRTVELACMAKEPDPSLGTMLVWMVDEEHGEAVVQTLIALPDADTGSLRARLERDAAACDGFTEQTPRGTFVVRYRVEPFLDLGDDAMLVEFGVEQQETGKSAGGRAAYVRYGGLVSRITVSVGEDEDDGAVLSKLERVARLAHDRVQTAAWYLRE